MFDWIKDRQLPELVAATSEGFCFKCSGRLTQAHPFDLEDPDEIEGEFARGGCAVCRHWLRAGHNAENGLDWFSAILINTKDGDLEGAMLTLTLNPPRTDDDYDDDDDDDFDDFVDFDDEDES